MSVTHCCQYCGADYACDTMREVSEDVYRCECASVDSCPGCLTSGACESCGKAPATGDGQKPFFCGPCEEDWLDNYEPGDDDGRGVSIAELSDRASTERAELRRRD